MLTADTLILIPVRLMDLLCLQHAGDVDIKAGTTKRKSNQYFARSTQPIGGGGCTPTLNLVRTGETEPMAVVEGPMCFGGWLGACFDTVFKVSTKPGKAGDVAVISKKVSSMPTQHALQDCMPSLSFAAAHVARSRHVGVVHGTVHRGGCLRGQDARVL